MSIWVVRHGRTEANASGLLLGRADPELDDLGRRQAVAIAAALPPDAMVLTSPLRRTAQTAAAHPVDAVTDDRLIELDYGDLDLRPLAEVPRETWAQWRADPDFRPPNGETLNELHHRVGDLLAEVSAAAAASEVVLYSHVSPIKAAVAWALGTGIEISWRSQVAQASITRIGVSDRGPSLHLFNDTHHLDGVAESSR